MFLLDFAEDVDVPFFAASTDGDSISTVKRTLVPGAFDPARKTAAARLRGLDDDDLKQQLSIIRGSFHAHVAISVADPERSTLDDAFPVAGFIDSESVIAEARRLAAVISDSAIRSPSGHVYWLGLQLNPVLEYREFQPLGYGLYDGRCGVALFLAASHATSGASEVSGSRQLALDALAPISRLLRGKAEEGGAVLMQSMGISAFTGVASLVYCLLRVAQFLSSDSLSNDARTLAKRLSGEPLESDRQFDILNGSAGVILVLLRLFAETGDAATLDRAVALGRHLVGNRVATASGFRAWKIPGFSTPLAGFSHGAAGIAHALLQLFAITDINEFREAALEAIAYEGTLYDAEISNWKDVRGFRTQEGNGFPASWCHGAPGIGLSRMTVAEDLQRAIRGTLTAPKAAVDHLCCGEFGRIEFLKAAGETEHARLRASRLLNDVKRHGGYKLLPNLYGITDPGFFQGLAGIGYSWLRLAERSHLPNVLLLE